MMSAHALDEALADAHNHGRYPHATPREPTPPAGWRLLKSGWCWVSPSEAVVVSFAVHADGRLSAPSVVGVGDFWHAVRELRQAIGAQAALVDYLAARAEWERAR